MLNLSFEYYYQLSIRTTEDLFYKITELIEMGTEYTLKYFYIHTLKSRSKNCSFKLRFFISELSFCY